MVVGMRYISSQYIDKKKNNDFYVILKDRTVVNIKYSATSQLKEILLLVQTNVKCSRHLLVQNDYVTLRHVLKIKKNNKMLCIKLSLIKQLCVVMNLPYNIYVDFWLPSRLII